MYFSSRLSTRTEQPGFPLSCVQTSQDAFPSFLFPLALPSAIRLRLTPTESPSQPCVLLSRFFADLPLSFRSYLSGCPHRRVHWAVRGVLVSLPSPYALACRFSLTNSS